MLIVAGYFIVDAEKRDAQVSAQQGLVRRARAFPGCLDLAITADPVDLARVNMFELWDTAESFGRWQKVAEASFAGIVGGDVKKYEVSSVGSPF